MSETGFRIEQSSSIANQELPFGWKNTHTDGLTGGVSHYWPNKKQKDQSSKQNHKFLFHLALNKRTSLTPIENVEPGFAWLGNTDTPGLNFYVTLGLQTTLGTEQHVSEPEGEIFDASKVNYVISRNPFVSVDATKLKNVDPSLASLNETIEGLTQLEAGWDGYDGLAVFDQVAHKAYTFLEKIWRHTNIPPDIVPLSDGGLQLEWFVGRFEIEVVISPDSPISVFVECDLYDELKEFTIQNNDILEITPIFKELHQ